MKKPINESLRNLGKIKLYKRIDPLNSHKYKAARGNSRKTLRQVPVSQQDGVKPPNTQQNLLNFIKGLTLSNKVIDVAKKASSGLWRISQNQVIDIAKKYKFNIPDEAKPMKHLGSTGIVMVRYKPGSYYLYKHHQPHRKRRIKSGVNLRKKYGIG